MFQLFVEANSIEANKLVPMLLTVIGSVHYILLWGLVSPKEKSFNELVATLKKQYDPEPIIIAESSVQLRTVSSVFVNERCTFSGANTSACVTIEY